MVKRKGELRLRTFTFYLLPLTFAALAACEVPQLVTRVVYEDPINFVRLEPDLSALPDVPRTLHQHPARIEPEEMANVLRGFTVREYRNWFQRMWSGEAPQEPAFTADDIGLLAPKLSEALAEAADDERVTFYLSRPQTSIKREVTSGGLYVHDGTLHFILSNYKIGYGIPAYGMVYDRRYPLMPTAPKGFEVFFNPASAVVHHRPSIWDRVLGREKDEVVIDLRKVPPPQPAA